MATNRKPGTTGAFFDQDMATHYDERNRQLAPISESMHFLLRLTLKCLPPNARILCVGVGTGADILALATAFPDWKFVGVDPSAEMLAVCRDKLTRAGLLGRCELLHGTLEDVPGGDFDAVVSLLVAHFISKAERPDFYQAARLRLQPGGYFVSTEICGDLDAPDFPALLENWKEVQTLMGATPESLSALPDMLRNVLTVLSPNETEHLVQAAGFENIVWFFQAFLVRGWYVRA